MASYSDIGAIENFPEYEIKNLLRSISLTRGKLLERRRGIRKSLVIAALDQIPENGVFTLEIIVMKIVEIAKCKIDKNDIIAVLDDFVAEGSITHSEEYSYVLKRRIELPGIELLTEPVWIEFSRILKHRWADYDPFIHSKTRDIFDSVLMKILTRYALSKPLENGIDYIPIENIKHVINNEISSRSIDRELGKKLFEVMLDYFCSNEKELLNCIINCYFWFIDLNLLSYEKDLTTIDFCDELNFLLLDSNFIVPLLCKTDVKHPLSISLTEFCNKSNIQIYFTDQTCDEIWGLVKASKNEMKLNPYRTINISNQFIDDYRNLNATKGIHYVEYILNLNKWPEFLKETYKIEQLPEMFSKNFDKIDFEYIKNTLPMLYDIQVRERARRNVDYIIRKRSDESYLIDAYCVSIISFIKKNPTVFLTKKELGPWYLTYDSLLSDLNDHYFRKNDEFGCVIQPRILLNYFLAFSKIEYDEKYIENLAKALLKYTVRNPKKSITIDEYAKELSVKIGLNEDDADILKDFLIKMPLFNELERSLQNGNVNDAERLFCEYIAHPNFEKLCKEVVNSEEKDVRIKELAIKLRESDIELQKEKAVREALERGGRANINIIIPTIIGFEPQTASKITELIAKLNEINAFTNESFPKPPQELNVTNAKSWIQKIQFALQTTGFVADCYTILQLVNQILPLLPK
jgi:hypothetical protein